MTLQCVLCGTPLKTGEATFELLPDGTIGGVVCAAHSQLNSTCAICTSKQLCDFETNPITMPKTIEKRIQRGPMTQIVQMRNPDRVVETCAKNCPCYDSEYQCGKQFGTCRNYKTILQEENNE